MDEKTYKTYKTFFEKCIKKAKINYYSKQLDKYKNDLKKSWSIINEVTGRSKVNKSKQPLKLIVDNKKITNDTLLRQEFNKYFVNVGPTLASGNKKYDRMLF